MHAPLHSMTESQPDRRRWFALAVIVAAQFMVVLDVAIVNVALPTIKTDLGFSQENLQWVVTAYSIMFGGVLLLGGRMADLLGRRRLFMAGLTLFSVSSLLDGLAWSEGSLIAFRALQGLGAALLSPAALSILTTTFPEGKERNFALGIWGAVSGSGGAAGVLLGGALTSSLDWSWIFFINVPVGALVLALTPRLVRESVAGVTHRHFDVPGAISITGGLMLLVYAMTRAVQHGWGTTETIALLAASAALIVAFVAIELRSQAPLLPMRMFRSRTLSGSNLAGLLMGAAVFSQFFLLTLYMQQVLQLLGAGDGRGLHRADADDHRLRERLAEARPEDRDPARAGARAGAREQRPAPLRAPSGRRALLLGSLPGVPDQRARDVIRLHPDDDRRARGRPSLRRRHRRGADQHHASRSAGRSASPRPPRSRRPPRATTWPRIRAPRRRAATR